jgi:nucleotide-binding universal stress UspA family protein
MKILLATDGSQNAIEAARFLTRLQMNAPIELTLLSVCYDPQSTGSEVIQPWFPEWLERQQAMFAQHHQELESMLSDRCSSVSKVLRDGHAARAILNEADANQADLIVMGAQGHSAVGRMLLGSVSDSVATHAHCSVLVVRPDTSGGEASSPKKPLSMAMAYDSSPAAQEALAEISSLGLPADNALTLISVSPIFDYMLAEGLAAVAVENEQAVAENMHRSLSELCEQLRATFGNVKGVVERGRHIGDTLVEVVAREACDLLVIGDAGHGLLHDWILGSTTKYVLRHSPSSIWLSRHHRRGTTTDTADQAAH